jgi:WD40 repeat protein
VLHIMSHGGFDPETGGGYIQLSGENGTARPISAVDLARLIAENPSLRLIVLNACESAFSSAEGIFTSTAEKLVREGVPAVVAMQYEITDTAALVFASSFYGQIAQGVPVDRAMTRAREAVKMTNDSLEWATPVLFLSSEETQIFEVPKPDTATPPIPDPPSKRGSDLRRLRVMRSAGPGGHMAAGPGDFLAVAGIDGIVRVISASTGQILSECALPQRTRLIQLAWSPWPRYLASLHEDGTIVVWNAETQVPARIIQAPAGQLDLLQQSDLLRSAVRHIDSLRSMTPRIGGIAFSGNGKWLAAVGGGRVHFFDTQGNHARELRLEPDGFAGSQWLVNRPGASVVLFTPGDRHVLVAAGDGTVRQFDVHGQVLMTLRHPKPVLGIAATYDRLATGSTDGQIRTWSWDSHLIWQTGHGSPAKHLAFSPDGSTLAVAADDGRLSLWDRGGALVGQAALTGRPVGIHCADDTVLTADQGGALELWSCEWQQPQEGHRD